MSVDKRLYTIWSDMRTRCRNPRHKQYHRYGGRGIDVSQAWDAYDAFAAWAKTSGYASDLTIDRIDNDKGYSPDNCRWATRKQQARNRADNRIVTVNGRDMTVAEAVDISQVRCATFRGRLRRGKTVEEAAGPVAHRRYGVVVGGEYKTFRELTEMTGLPPKTISTRISRGWSPEKALSPKVPLGTGTARYIEFDGQTLCVAGWARRTGIPRHTLVKRIKYGWSTERMLTTPPRKLSKKARS